MDKYEYKVRADEIKSLIAEGEYAEAVKIADTIDWRRVKSVMMLCTISDLYKINRRYEDSRDILLLAYEKHSGGRLIVYSLCELSIKLEEYVQAIEYYKEFVQLAPKDSGRYVLQYKLYEAQEVSLEERIAVLEEFKKKDYREKWAYELAYLYHRVGLETKCVEECDEIVLWFGDGRYVLKALELKQLHQPLSEEQQEKYEQLRQTGGIIQSDYVAQSNAIKEEANVATEEEDDDEYSIKENVLTDPTQEIPSKELEDIQVKTVDVSQYNTINLQKELAESMKEFLENNPTAEMPVENVALEMEQTKIFEPVAEGEETAADDETAQQSAFVEADEAGEEGQSEISLTGDLAEMTPVYVSQDTDEMQLLNEGTDVSKEVFFGNTAEVSIEEVVSELAEKNAEAAKEYEQATLPIAEEKPVQATSAEKVIGMPAASPDPALSNTGVIKTFVKPSGYDNLLSQEYDGQISLVVPEEEKVEKQITGQLSIDDIMTEWERIKKENERKRMEEIRERVQKQTNTLFADFDESTKTGLLEELEKAMISAAMKEEKKRIEEGRPRVIKVADIEAEEAAKEQALKEQEKTAAKEAEKEAVKKASKLIEEVQELGEVEELEEIEEPQMSEDTSEVKNVTVPAEPAKKAEAAEDVSDAEEQQEAEEAVAVEEVDITEIPEVTVALEDDETEAAEDEQEAEPAAEESEEDSEAEQETDTEESHEEDKAASDKAKAREMTQSEREQFAPFIHHKRTRRQIVETIDNISMASYAGNVVITGEEGTGTTALAKLLVKEVQLSDSNFSGKVAKISGATMNKKDVAATLDKLEDGALIIEGAATMKKDTVDALLKELEKEDKGMIVLLTDSKQKMDEFLLKNEGLLPLFNLRVDVEALDDQTLVKYAKKYALDQEYAIDELGVLALHTRIAEMQTSDHEVTLSEIEEIVDEAIYFADKKTPAHFFDILLGKRYDEEDMVVLREKDFMHY
ncbi:MAG: hypothetical protein IJO65_09745 [Lachnospiraceae bacterium]|nr:hypothetical protein [Lachnospiraceae bacterium]